MKRKLTRIIANVVFNYAILLVYNGTTKFLFFDPVVPKEVQELAKQKRNKKSN